MPSVFTSVTASLHPRRTDMAKEKKPEEMTEEEIAEANGESLPDREAMSVINLGEPAGGFTVDPPPTDIE
jgi:hypothetical protein